MTDGGESARADRVARIDAFRPSADLLDRAARLLRGGGLVAFPTETVYGIGANALDETAVARIFEAKGRPRTNPLIVHVADAAAARELVTEWSEEAERLSREFWPGPLTLVLPKGPLIGPEVTAGLPTVAIRVPAHPVARGLLAAARIPIAAPSANPFMRLSPTTAEHVWRGLGDRVDLILDAGPADVGIESTVVDLSGPIPLLLRSGTIPLNRIEAVLGMKVQYPGDRTGEEAMPSPGMLERHYSPHARLVLIEGGSGADLQRQVESARRRGERIGALLIQLPADPCIHAIVRLPPEPAAYARALFASLHELDDRGVELILAERPPAGPEWAGVHDRLRRASDAAASA